MDIYTLLIIVTACLKIVSALESGRTNTEQFDGVTVYEHKDFKGRSLNIKNEASRICINLHRNSFSGFLNQISSLKLQGANSTCLFLYDTIGCSGPPALTVQSDSSYLENLVQKDFNDKATSLRFCNRNLPESNLEKLNDGKCRGECKPRGKLYFWCYLRNGTKDYCSPQPGTDQFGNYCDGGGLCSKTETIARPLLFQFNRFGGWHIEIPALEPNECFNMRYAGNSDENFDNRASSVDVGNTCIILHEHIGCTGRQVKLSLNDNEHCHDDLTRCVFDDMTTSVSLCDSEFEHKEAICETIGYDGICCIDKCETRGKPYFWCATQNGSWQYCSPRQGIDFLGNSCKGSCHFNQTKFPQTVTLYEDLHQKGKKIVLSSHTEDSIKCLNLGNKTISSIYMDSSCVQLYDNIGCTGFALELSSESWSDICWGNLARCEKYRKIVSAQLCSTRLPPLYSSPKGLSGRPCSTDCRSRDLPYFWCHLEDSSWDFCSPRPAMNYLGNHCETDCNKITSEVPSKDLVSGNHSVTLYIQDDLMGKSMTISTFEERSCFDLDYDSHMLVNFNKAINSIEMMPGTCLLLFDSAGCTGNFTVLSDWDKVECRFQLKHCDWKGRVSSLRFCTTSNLKNQPNKTSKICIRQNCSHPGDATVNIKRATLYSKKFFEGKNKTIKSTDGKECFNLEYDFESSTNLQRAVQSVTMDNKASLFLYNEIGCTGEMLKLSQVNDIQCSRDLVSCGKWHEKASSVSFLDFNSKSRNVIARGGDCSSSCKASSSNFFQCTTNAGFWDFCSPRPGLNYMGEEWGADRIRSSSSGSTQFPVLYDEKEFMGNSCRLENIQEQRCLNLRNDNITSSFHHRLASVDVQWECLVLYEEIGCVGNFLEIFPEDTIHCHQNLEACGWKNRVSSISLCETYFPIKYSKPVGSTGEDCFDACKPRGRSYFWCHLKQNGQDFCLPRIGQDYSGNDCETNCAYLDDSMRQKLLMEDATFAAATKLENMKAFKFTLLILLCYYL